MERFNRSLKDAKADKKRVQKELASCLASGTGIGALQRRTAEIDALLAAAPDAEKELKAQLEKAVQVEKTTRPRLEAVVKKIEGFEKALIKPPCSWSGLGRA